MNICYVRYVLIELHQKYAMKVRLPRTFALPCQIELPRTFAMKTRITAKLGCPRNNQIFFSVRTETNRNSICFSCFSVSFAKPKIFFFRFVSVCFGVSDQYQNNRNKPKKPINSALCQGILETINFFFGSNRNKLKLNLFRLFFSLFFLRNP